MNGFFRKLLAPLRGERAAVLTLTHVPKASSPLLSAREDFGMDFAEDMECVCEYFKVVYQK